MTALPKKYVLLNVNILDANSLPPKRRMFVEVIGNRLGKIGPIKDYKKHPDLQEIPLDGHYIMPGLIDAHVHLAGGRGDYEWQEHEVFMEPMLVRGMRSVYEAQKMLKRGVTAVRDISLNGLYLKRIFNEGILAGPKIIACGRGLSRTGGHGDAPQFNETFIKEQHYWAVLADGPEEIRKQVRRQLREGADQLKIWATGGDNWPTDRNTDTHYTPEEIKTFVNEAHMIKGTLCCAHAENTESIKVCVDAGVDTIEHGEALTEEIAEQMVRQNTILTPTLGILLSWFTEIISREDKKLDNNMKIRPHGFLYRTIYEDETEKKAEAYIKQVKDSFAVARYAGVKIALGSDCVYEPLTEYGEYSLKEFKWLTTCGMTVPEAIRSATLISAEALGMSHLIGTIEPSKIADLLILKKDPTEDTEVLYNQENLRYVIVNGRLAVEEGRLCY